MQDAIHEHTSYLDSYRYSVPFKPFDNLRKLVIVEYITRRTNKRAVVAIKPLWRMNGTNVKCGKRSVSGPAGHSRVQTLLMKRDKPPIQRTLVPVQPNVSSTTTKPTPRTQKETFRPLIDPLYVSDILNTATCLLQMHTDITEAAKRLQDESMPRPDALFTKQALRKRLTKKKLSVLLM